MASGNHCCSFFLILSCPQLWVAPHDNPLCCLLLHSRLGPLTQSPLMSNWNSHTFSCFKQSKKQIFKAIWSLPIYILHKTSPIICKPQVSQILGYIKDPRLLLHFGTVWPGGSPPSCSVSLPKHKHFLSHFPFFPANILVLFPPGGWRPCLCLWKVSCGEGVPLSDNPDLVLPKQSLLLPLMVLCLPRSPPPQSLNSPRILIRERQEEQS